MKILFFLVFIIFMTFDVYAIDMNSARYKINISEISNKEPTTIQSMNKINLFKTYVDKRPYTFSISHTYFDFNDKITNTNLKIEPETNNYQIVVLKETDFTTLSGYILKNALYFKTDSLSQPQLITNNKDILLNVGKPNINFSIRIPSNQPNGNYRAIVNFVALPLY